MARKGDQETLPGVPGPARRKVIDEIEDISLEIDKMCGKRTAQSDAIAEKMAERQAMLVKHKLELYTYENADHILQDVFLETVTKKRKSKLNPKKSKEKSE